MSGFRPRFFIDQDAAQLPPGGHIAPGSEVLLSPEDTHHALRVLRLKPGDPCEVVVGAAVYAAAVGGTKQPLGLVIGSKLEGTAAGATYRSQVGLVQAVTRPALLDEVLEKGTEVGTSFFMVVPADESTRIPQASVAGRLERWRRIVVEAAKQSKHLQVPTVEWAASLKEALDILRTRSTLCLLLEPSAKMALRERLEPPAGAQAPPLAAGGTGALALCVGPESGWSERELESFSAAGIEAVRLGQGVLRAETAGPVAVAATRLVIGDW